MPTATLDFDSNPKVSLESQLQRLALEASAVSNVIDTFKGIVPSLAEKLREVYASLKSDDDLSRELKNTRNKFGDVKSKFAHASFLNYSKTAVSVPEGFKGNLLDYIQVLAGMSQEIFLEANKTLGSYNFALAAFISNKESKTSLQDHSHLFHQVAKRREELNDRLKPFFPTTSNLSKNYLGDVISRFADVEALVAQSEKLNQQRKSQNIKDITEAVKKSVDMLDIIIEDTQSNGVAKVSGAAAMNISQGAYELGKYVEFIAIYRYRVEQALTAVGSLVESLDRIL